MSAKLITLTHSRTGNGSAQCCDTCIALAFRQTYPANFTEYEAVCEAQQVRTGCMFVTADDPARTEPSARPIFRPSVVRAIAFRVDRGGAWRTCAG